jgi:hypothetical protein
MKVVRLSMEACSCHHSSIKLYSTSLSKIVRLYGVVTNTNDMLQNFGSLEHGKVFIVAQGAWVLCGSSQRTAPFSCLLLQARVQRSYCNPYPHGFLNNDQVLSTFLSYRLVKKIIHIHIFM